MILPSKLTVYHQATLPSDEDTAHGKINNESFSTDVNKINAAISSDTATTLINWAKDYVGITDDVYIYTKIEQTQSINEILAE